MEKKFHNNKATKPNKQKKFKQKVYDDWDKTLYRDNDTTYTFRLQKLQFYTKWNLYPWGIAM